MTQEIFLALVALAVGTLFTPGPNNAMLAASGATFGFRRTLPHMLGVAIGFPLMLLVVGLALGELFRASAVLREGLRWGGAALLLWIAWKIATADPADPAQLALRPMRFSEAAAFQWINPKAWSMAIAATSQFIPPEDPLATASIVAGTFLSFGLLSSATWNGAGQVIAGLLTSRLRRRVFNLVMAGLIVVSTAQLVAH
jgi:threonine/homoserine/homoserine lactone efflux protein